MKTQRSFGQYAVAAMLMVGMVAGCQNATRNPLPAKYVEVAQPVDFPNVRAWGGRPSPLFQRDLVESIKQVRQNNPKGLADASGYVNILALSGGGPDGAYAAGLLGGWSAAGTRPTFKLVTGVSTGALMAPFAFLGSEYDTTLKEFYTTVRTDDVLRSKPILEALSGGDSLADSSPLAKLIEKTVNDKVLAAIAQEHLKGRRLFIATTNLDARRAVIWNMGAIAASGKPQAAAMFRKVMRASASIPVAMGPIYMPVEAEGKVYDELHVDGGVTTEVFFYGFMLDLPAAIREAGLDPSNLKARIYIVRSGQFAVPYEEVKPRLMPIASRAISSLITTQSLGDLYRIYAITQRDHIDYNVTYIPPTYVSTAKEAFDPEDMKRLYELGYKWGLNGGVWEKMPPGLERSTEGK